MKMREKIKRFWTMDVHSHEGFTLVELIIVIAILAILSSVAVAGYSSYIDKANKQADQTLVAQIKHALELYYYNNMIDGVAAVGITSDGIKVEEGSFAEAALAAAGISLSNSLKYTKWPNAATSQQVLNHFSNRVNTEDDKYGALAGVYSGDVDVTFADDIEDLYSEMQDVASWIGGGSTGGAQLVQNAAGITTGANSIDPSDFADKWSSNLWDSSYLMGTDTYDGTANSLTGTALNNAIANAAVIKARNTVLAGVIRSDLAKTYGSEISEADLSTIYNMFANYSYSGTQIPLDVVALFEGPESVYGAEQDAFSAQWNQSGLDNGYVVDILESFYSYLGTDTAKADGLAYYAMMDTVNSTAKDSVSDTYWEEMEDAVGLYASILRGEVSLNSLSAAYENLGNLGDGAIVVSAVMTNGTIVIDATSDDA